MFAEMQRGYHGNGLCKGGGESGYPSVPLLCMLSGNRGKGGGGDNLHDGTDTSGIALGFAYLLTTTIAAIGTIRLQFRWSWRSGSSL